MDDLAASDVDSHMTVVTDHISRLHLRLADSSASAREGTRIPGRGDSKVRVYQIDESGTVGSVGQAVAAVHIGTPHKLQPVGRDGAADSSAAPRRTASGASS